MLVEVKTKVETPDGEVVDMLEFERVATRLDRIIENRAAEVKKFMEKSVKIDGKIREGIEDLTELLCGKVERDSEPA